MKGDIAELTKGLGAMFDLVTKPKKKAVGMSLKKSDGKKTSAVAVRYDDGSEEELSVN